MSCPRLCAAALLLACGCSTRPYCEVFPDECLDSLGDESSSTGDETSTDDTGSSSSESSTSDGATTSSTESSSDDTMPRDPIIFASNPAADYTRVDRSGMPALNLALITSKDTYNATNPLDDVNAVWVPELTSSLTNIHAVLDDDLIAANLVPCGVSDCLAQAAPLIIPDVLVIDITQASAFPNGRPLDAPVMDIMLSVLLLDQNKVNQDRTTLIGTNPTANDAAFSPGFPYLAAPN